MYILICLFIFFLYYICIYLLKNKSILYPLAISIFLVLVIIYSKQSFAAAKSGLYLWIDTVFPALFPFIVGSNLLISLGFVELVGILLQPIMYPLFGVQGCGSFALVMGMTSGYPIGAKITASLRENSLISKIEAERLISFTNNSGPLFIIGAVSVGMLRLPNAGYFLLAIHYLSALTVGFLFKFYKYTPSTATSKSHIPIFKKAYESFLLSRKKNNKAFGLLLGESIKDGMSLMLQIGGFIIIFSVLTRILEEIKIFTLLSAVLAPTLNVFGIDHSSFSGIFKGIFEITNGIQSIASTDLPLIQKLSISSFLIAWSGLSIHFQTISIISKVDIRISVYFIAKLIQSFIAVCYTLILYPFSASFLQNALVTFSPFQQRIPFNRHIEISINTLIILSIGLFFIGMLSTYVTSYYKNN